MRLRTDYFSGAAVELFPTFVYPQPGLTKHVNSTFMKILSFLVLLTCSLLSMQSYAQPELETDLNLSLDSTVFEGRRGMLYYNEGNKDVFMIAFVAPQDYNTAQEKAKEEKRITVSKSEEVVMNGKRVQIQEGMMNKNGIDMHVYTYLVEVSKSKSFFLMGSTLTDLDSHKAAFKQAAESFIFR